MKMYVVPVACALAVSLLPAAASAQTTPLDGRLIISINGVGQPGSENVRWTDAFDAYGEPASVVTDQEIKTGGGMLDFGAAYRLTRQMGVGVAFSSFSTERGATMVGNLPHPIFFGQGREFSLTTSGLEHRQRAVHLQAVYFMPFVENVDFMLSAGPTFFRVTQSFVRFESFSEVGAPFTDVNITQRNVTQREGAVGFNIGADVTYTLTPMIGVGGMLRYTRGSADFTPADGQSLSIDTGGFQAGAGLRLRF